MVTVAPQQAALLARLADLRQQPAWCDILLCLRDGHVRAPSFLLAAMSPVFHAVLRTDMAEGRTRILTLPTLTCRVFECLTTFYLGEEEEEEEEKEEEEESHLFSPENILDVVVASDMYQMSELKARCDDILPAYCSLENCLQLRRIAKLFRLQRSAEAIDRFIGENFAAVVEMDEFHDLEEEEVKAVLRNPDVVATEDHLSRKVFEWMRTRETKTQLDEKSKTEIFAELRLSSMSTRFLSEHVLDQAFVQGSDTLRTAVLAEIRRRGTHHQFEAKPRRRGTADSKISLVVLGTHHNDAFFLAFSTEVGEWQALSPPPLRTEACAARVAPNLVILSGGCTDGPEKSTFVYSASDTTSSWFRGPDLLQPRYAHAMVVASGTAFVVGGYSRGFLTSIEGYGVQGGRWERVGDLVRATGRCGVAAVDDVIVVVGGTLPGTERVVQTFDVRTRTSAVLEVELPPLRSSRVQGASFGSTAMFVSGEGEVVRVRRPTDSHLELESCAKLELAEARRQFGLYLGGGCLGLLGGRTGERYVRSVDCFPLLPATERQPSVELPPLPFEMAVTAVLPDT